MVVCWNMLELTLPDSIYMPYMFDTEHVRIFRRLATLRMDQLKQMSPNMQEVPCPLRETCLSTTEIRGKRTPNTKRPTFNSDYRMHLFVSYLSYAATVKNNGGDVFIRIGAVTTGQPRGFPILPLPLVKSAQSGSLHLQECVQFKVYRLSRTMPRLVSLYSYNYHL